MLSWDESMGTFCLKKRTPLLCETELRSQILVITVRSLVFLSSCRVRALYNTVQSGLLLVLSLVEPYFLALIPRKRPCSLQAQA